MDLPSLLLGLAIPVFMALILLFHQHENDLCRKEETYLPSHDEVFLRQHFSFLVVGVFFFGFFFQKSRKKKLKWKYLF